MRKAVLAVGMGAVLLTAGAGPALACTGTYKPNTPVVTSTTNNCVTASAVPSTAKRYGSYAFIRTNGSWRMVRVCATPVVSKPPTTVVNNPVTPPVVAPPVITPPVVVNPPVDTPPVVVDPPVVTPPVVVIPPVVTPEPDPAPEPVTNYDDLPVQPSQDQSANLIT